jgi:hypothetical protein
VSANPAIPGVSLVLRGVLSNPSEALRRLTARRVDEVLVDKTITLVVG